MTQHSPGYVWEEPQLRIEHHRRTGSYNMRANHYHDRYELYYLIAGQRNYFIEDRTYRVNTGEVVLIDISELHKTSDSDLPAEHERIVVNFSPAALPGGADAGLLLSGFSGLERLVRFEPAQRREVEALFGKLVRESQNAAPGFRTYLRLILAELLILVQRRLQESPPGRPLPASPLQEKILEIVRFINSSYSEPLTLPFLARQFAISPFHLSRTFKKVTGFGFVEYINSVRIREAERLLKETRLPVTEIAGRAGFENLTHFERVFKKISGSAPLAFRKRGGLP
ncbi:AraC-like DNA-binding protein [Hydrogenispora ethanolica]|jgi:AraC-like DNA-binding protein|uniref:AraC-like DNA-binding protein n=1 Tax=Hydrogenispora ethanolica TaxID=1082276 RepID=A0A4R1SAI6_HYDET|nr:AraC family transcriptional regulator [Hydrogenispora ethanolica]TCL76536.1 AraC-like DNA-binding protein [Hydrogenispora ethanolica]